MEVLIYYKWNPKNIMVPKGIIETTSQRSHHMYHCQFEKVLDIYRYRLYNVSREYLTAIIRKHNSRLVKQYVFCLYQLLLHDDISTNKLSVGHTIT